MTPAQRITSSLGGRWCGSYGVARCPAHHDRSPSLKITDDERKLDGIDVHCFAACDWRDVKAELRRWGLLDGGCFNYRAKARTKPTLPENLNHDRAYTEQQLAKARYLLSQAEPVKGTSAETYVREVRGYSGPLTPSLRFLRPLREEHHPAMIAAFAPADEPEPGLLSICEDQMRGVHLTLLKADGRGKAGTERDKIMVGPSAGCPIVLSPLSDSLGLVICEGIEDGLTLHEATGLGVWAAGSASRLPSLAHAVPRCVDCVTVAADDDEAGRTGAARLASELRARDIHVEITVPVPGRLV